MTTTDDADGCYSLVYASRATQPLDRHGLVQLLEQSRTNNDAQQITGLLVYRDGTFVQLLEGEQHRVEALYAKILGDRRHHRAVVVATHRRALRQFPGWSMGFHDADRSPTDLDGYSDVLEGDDHVQIETRFVLDLLDLLTSGDPAAGWDPPTPDRPRTSSTPLLQSGEVKPVDATSS